jgi:chemotaxis protein methyltransferase CheR
MEANTREFDYTSDDFNKVKTIIHRKAGISLVDSKSQLVYSRLARRLRVLGLKDFKTYLRYLETDSAEQEEFVNALTTNLTSFFREAHHFDTLKKLAQEKARKRQGLRVWCAAASTGEEPYSIAITLAEAYGRLDAPVEIVASDIDSNVLREAEQGIYALSRIEALSIEQKKRFFQKGVGANEGKARVIAPLRNLIEYKKINLLDSSWLLEGKFDVIFCRNVMIYFDKSTQLRLFQRMLTLLNPDGFYFAGHSESFTNVNTIAELIGKSTYRPVNSSQNSSASESLS